jgi:hypothetical protein
MTTVAIIVEPGASLLPSVHAVRAITGESMVAIREAIVASRPVYSRELFMNDFATVGEEIRRLLRSLDAACTTFRILEDEQLISRETLLNIIADSEKYRLPHET